MPLSGKGTFRLERRSKSGRLHIPAALVRDSQFPIDEGEVDIEIVNKTLIIRQKGK